MSRQGRRRLQRWARLKLGVSDPKEARRASFLIARAIKSRGIPGLHAFAKGSKYLGTGVARRIYRAELARAKPR